MTICKGSGASPIEVESQLICPSCFGEAPMDRHRVSGMEIAWKVALHQPMSGLRYRCIICLQPSQSFGTATVCTAAGGHHLLVYPFRCSACSGSVRVVGGLPQGFCTKAWGGKHQLDTAVMTLTETSGLKIPEARGYYKGRGRFNVKKGSLCTDCGNRLAFKDGMTKCLSCLSEEALRRAE